MFLTRTATSPPREGEPAGTPFPHARIWKPWNWKRRQRKEKRFNARFERSYRGSSADGSRELVPGSWNLVRERTLTTGLCAEGCYSKHSSVCKRTQLPRRGVKVKMVWEAERWVGAWWEIISKRNNESVHSILCSTESQWREWSEGETWTDLEVWIIRTGWIVLDLSKFWKEILRAALQTGVTVI